MDLAGAAIVVAKKYARSGIGRGKLAGAGKEKKEGFFPLWQKGAAGLHGLAPASALASLCGFCHTRGALSFGVKHAAGRNTTF
jgi:hypothetical protein